MEQNKLNKILNEHKLWLNGMDGKRADLREADLRGVDLREADLRGANLREADLYGADLRGADLYGADLYGVDVKHTKGIMMACPEEGSFIAFKKCRDDRIVKLEILADAKRSSATGRKCRCDKAKVLSISDINGFQEFNDAISKHDLSFVYKVGEIVSVEDFCDDRWNECASGIHFFITRQEAVEY